MRLQLRACEEIVRQALRAAAVAAAVLHPFGGAAAAGSGVAARVDVYADDWITAVSPSSRGVAQAGDAVTVEARYAADVVSGATPVLTADAISSATRFSETRHEVHGAVTVAPAATWSLGGSYLLSREPDYLTHALGMTAGAELLDRMAQVSVSYHLSLETLGRVTDPAFAERAVGHALDAAWTQVLGRRTTLTLLLTGQLVRCGAGLGCHANPYRFVPVVADGAVLLAVPERHPDLRARGAAALRLAHNVGGGRAVHAGYRFHEDNWSVTGHTADLSLAQSLAGDALIVRLDGRFTRQGAASFHRDTYTTDAGAPAVPAYRTADPELSRLWDAMVGARLEWSFDGPGPIWRTRLNLRLQRLWYRYLDERERPRRDAWLAGGGISAEL